MAKISKLIPLAPSSGKSGYPLIHFAHLTVLTRPLLNRLLHIKHVSGAHFKCLMKLYSNRSHLWKKSEGSKTAKESLSRLSRYLCISISIYTHILISRLLFSFTHCVTHQISVSGVPSFTQAVLVSPSFRQTQAAVTGTQQTQISSNPVNQNHSTTVLPHSISPCASISSICHQPSLTHALGVLTFMGVVARKRLTSRRFSIFFHITPSEGRTAVSDHVCVSSNDVTSGAVHIHPRCHTRGLSLRRDGHTGV